MTEDDSILSSIQNIFSVVHDDVQTLASYPTSTCSLVLVLHIISVHCKPEDSYDTVVSAWCHKEQPNKAACAVLLSKGHGQQSLPVLLDNFDSAKKKYLQLH